ncbi:MAG: hypothetical protein WC721_22455 [Victivallaceae bacterium]
MNSQTKRRRIAALPSQAKAPDKDTKAGRLTGCILFNSIMTVAMAFRRWSKMDFAAPAERSMLQQWTSVR